MYRTTVLICGEGESAELSAKEHGDIDKAQILLWICMAVIKFSQRGNVCCSYEVELITAKNNQTS